MKPIGRLAAFSVLLSAVFAAALLAGREADPEPVTDEHEEVQAEARGDEDGTTRSHASSALALELVDRELPLRKRAPLRFRVVDDGGEPLTRFEVEHEKRMHLIVVRTDGTGFQHLHPNMDETGTWATRIRLKAPGAYRAFADFRKGGVKQTLYGDLVVDGKATYRDLPEPAAQTRAGGFDVDLSAQGATLSFLVTQDGVPVHVDEYLGAGGHLVALREGDLAYAHNHPSTHGDHGAHGASGHGTHGPIAFNTDFPGPGRYRLYFQFQVAGQVHTAEFTHEVAT